ncbi:MAG: cyclic nucleotide-binding domain-containing protein [Anaerolineae bacterium]|nr:cyclic nucleotide-binding domain-containing protein [Anaerolineae bacterium]
MSEELIEQLNTIDRFQSLPPERRQEIARIAAKLRPAPLFESLSSAELLALAAEGTLRRYESGDVIIRKGDTDKTFYVIVRGYVRVWSRDGNGSPRLLNYHSRGDFFGEMAPLNDMPRSANVDVVEDVELVVFSDEGFERIIAYPQISEYLRSWGQERIRRSNRAFDGKHWDEISIVLAHKSWVALMQMVFFPITLIILSLAVGALLHTLAQAPSQIILSVVIAISVGMGLWTFWMWEDWRNDDLIVTSKRIVHIERILIPPFPTERHEEFVEQVQDITTRNHGLWTWLFGVHSLEVKTAGAGTIRFPYLDDAAHIQEEIFRARRLARTRRIGEERSRIREKLLTELERPVDPITPLESGEQVQVTPEHTGLVRIVDYFIPRTRIVKSDQIIWRKHWLILLGAIVPPVLLLIGCLIALGLALARPGILARVPLSYTVPVPLLALLFAFAWYLWRYDGWRNDVYIVTESRIVDIEGSPFHLQKESRKESTFDVIQNTDASSPNWLFRVLRIGNVEIHTASQQEPFSFDLVPRPEEVQQEIFKRLTAFRESRAREENERQYNEFSRWFGTYHRSLSEQKE